MNGAGKYPSRVKHNTASELAVARPSFAADLSIIPIRGDIMTEIRKKRSQMSPYDIARLVAKGSGMETTISRIEKRRYMNRDPLELYPPAQLKRITLNITAKRGAVRLIPMKKGKTSESGAFIMVLRYAVVQN